VVETRTPPAELFGVRAFVGGPTTRRATLLIDATRGALLERYASAPPAARPDGRLAVQIDVADDQWFGRLLLRLGPGVDVEPRELAGAARAVAEVALRRYT
jgi:predicted DNA-binding transcriptional regulator YafY